MRIGYFEPLSRAWDRTRVILWQPFDLAKWLLLAFAAWVAGLTESLAHAFSPRKRRSRSRRRKPLPTEIEADEVPAW